MTENHCWLPPPSLSGSLCARPAGRPVGVHLPGLGFWHSAAVFQVSHQKPSMGPELAGRPEGSLEAFACEGPRTAIKAKIYSSSAGSAGRWLNGGVRSPAKPAKRSIWPELCTCLRKKRKEEEEKKFKSLLQFHQACALKLG